MLLKAIVATCILLLAVPAGASSIEKGDDVNVVVKLSDRKLEVRRNGDVYATFDVAVGQDEHETPTGQFMIEQVDLNPDFTPPDEEWASDMEAKEPGEDGNPMGRARIMYDPPYAIHGTDETGSIGEAASHGSIRVAIDEVLELAEMILRAGGRWQGEDWFKQMTEEKRDETHQIVLERHIPIEIED
jgi:lipoprotein-anchoring transpeptidase ErfK/SrfK